MKKNLVFAIVLFSMMFTNFYSYSQTLTISSNSLQVSASAKSTVNFTISSDTYWGIYNIPSWIVLDTNWGSGNRMMTVTATQNPYTFTRNNTFTIYKLDSNWAYSGDTSITITQAASTYGISDSTLYIGASTQSKAACTIFANTYWEIANLPSWLTVNNNWKSSSETVTFTASTNPLYTTRTDTFTVHRLMNDGTYFSTPVKIIQAASQNGVSSNSVTLASSASSAKIGVKANSTWTVSNKKSWLSVSPTSYSGNDSITITALANTTIYYRVDTVSITCNGGTISSVIVIQNPGAISFSISPTIVNLATASSSSSSVTVSSNTNWAVMQFPSWISTSNVFAFGDSSFTVTASQNPYTIARKDTAYIYWLDAYYNFYSDTSLCITQSASTYGISDTALTIAATAGSTSSFTITTDAYWEIIDLPSWLTVNKNYLTGTATITLMATANPQFTTRTGTFTVHRLLADLTYLTATVTVHQQAGSSGVSDENITLAAIASSTAEVIVHVATSWNVTGKKSWLSLNKISSTGNDTLIITAQANTSIYYRVDTLIITVSGGNTYSVVVVQNPSATAFAISPSKIIFAAVDNSSVTITITSNTNWGVVNLPTWLYSTQVVGYSDSIFTFTAKQNTTGQNRVDSLLAYWYDVNYNYYQSWIPVIQKTTSTTQSISLIAGWNMFSIHVEPIDSSISTLFSPIISDVLEIKDNQSFYSPTNNSVFNQLQYIGQAKAYFIKMKNPNTLTITGTPSITTITDVRNSLELGWNLVGCPFASATAIPTVFDISTINIIKNFNGFYIPGNSLNSLSSITPSQGYFIKKN